MSSTQRPGPVATDAATAAAGGNGWEVVIGLEIHAQLATRSKIFSGSPTAYGAAPNTPVSYTHLTLPTILRV